MKRNRLESVFLEQLRKTPIVQVVCEKIGVVRSTVYRWKKDPKFAKAFEEALAEGEAFITDISESQLISLIKDKNFPAIQMWLKNHHPKYGDKVELSANVTLTDEELTPEQKALVRRALKLASFNKSHDTSTK